MWTLVQSQFRYHGSWMLMVLVPALLLAAALTGLSVRAGKISALWMMWTLVGGLVTLIVFYQQDLRERRPLLWLELPLSPRQVVGARLVVPLFIHLPILGVAFLAMLLLSPEAFDRGSVGEVLAGNGLAMMVSYSIYAGEEVGIRLAGHRVLFWLAQLGFSGTLVFVALDPLGWFPEIDSAPGVVGLHLVAALCAFAAYRMYQSRTNFLIGTDPSCGLPTDWSQAE